MQQSCCFMQMFINNLFKLLYLLRDDICASSHQRSSLHSLLVSFVHSRSTTMAPAVMVVWGVTALMSTTSALPHRVTAMVTCGRTRTGSRWDIPVKWHAKCASLLQMLLFLRHCVWLQMTLQQICADVNRAQAWGRQACPDSSQKNTSGKPTTGKAVPKILKVRKYLLGCQTCWDVFLFLQYLSPPQPPTSRPEGTVTAGSKHTSPPISKSTVWTISSGVKKQLHHDASHVFTRGVMVR